MGCQALVQVGGEVWPELRKNGPLAFLCHPLSSFLCVYLSVSLSACLHTSLSVFCSDSLWFILGYLSFLFWFTSFPYLIIVCVLGWVPPKAETKLKIGAKVNNLKVLQGKTCRELRNGCGEGRRPKQHGNIKRSPRRVALAPFRGDRVDHTGKSFLAGAGARSWRIC